VNGYELLTPLCRLCFSPLPMPRRYEDWGETRLRLADTPIEVHCDNCGADTVALFIRTQSAGDGPEKKA
jgi:hypothetical protein